MSARAGVYDSHYLFQKKMQREERNIIKSKGETDGEGGRDAVILTVLSHGWLQEFNFLNFFISFAIFLFPCLLCTTVARDDETSELLLSLHHSLHCQQSWVRTEHVWKIINKYRQELHEYKEDKKIKKLRMREKGWEN